MRSDSLVMHNENVGEVVGAFYGTPIHEVNLDDVELIEDLDRDLRINLSRASQEELGEPPAPELLPGEVVCSDGVIRRDTTTEVVGYNEFHAYKDEPGTRRVSLEEALRLGVLTTWRPDGIIEKSKAFAVVHEEVGE